MPLFEPPALEYVSSAVVELGEVLDVGETLEGHRRVVPITGGSFTGPGLTGRIQAVGADWQRLLPDGTTLVEARYLVETIDGLVSITSTGVRSGPPEVLAALARGEHVERSRYEFRLTVTLSGAVERRLSAGILVASAERTPGTVRYDLYRLT
ncbi:DUF3237 family protein [Amycolatopsis sp. NBC_01286]|uniref:DUF3237 family protein n=1 Tax=Amycolatopsis sp. NBC_01286 TaxID=2903560 RepID=UPI002E131F5C|nr:DUF3237 family protein [Amycolatopsis sp. NBC_01286]